MANPDSLSYAFPKLVSDTEIEYHAKNFKPALFSPMMREKIDKDCIAYFQAKNQKRKFHGSRMDVTAVPTESTLEKEPVLSDN